MIELTKDEEPIVALCTPQGSGALGLIRVSGTGVRTLIDPITKLASGVTLTHVASHTVHYGRIQDTQATAIDHVMITVMDGPRTFTGQDTIEITCHNNPFIITALITKIIAQGARAAQNGEFTRRAFLNNKIDLIQAEAINELIHAHTQLALKQSLAQLQGSFSHWLEFLQKELVRALAWCSASFEFLDDEAEFGPQIKQHLVTLVDQLQGIKRQFDQQQHIRQGVRIALIGSVNAGKSSLFNLLLGHSRAIVTSTPGTTRDVIEAGVYRNGNYLTFIDTAGLRQTNDAIEHEGIKKSHEEGHKADIILLVFDSSRQLTGQEQEIYAHLQHLYPHKIMLVYNKADLPCYGTISHEQEILYVSSMRHIDAERIEQALEQKIQHLFSDLESPFLLNQRQYTLLQGVEQKLHKLIAMLTMPIVQYELVAYDLQDALEDLSQLTGKSVSEAGLDTVFKEFCVGK